MHDPRLFGITAGMLCGLKSKPCLGDYCGCCTRSFLRQLKVRWIVQERTTYHHEDESWLYQYPLSVKLRNFHDEYFGIFFHEILPLYTYIYLGFVDFYGLLYKTADMFLVFRKQRPVFHADDGQ